MMFTRKTTITATLAAMMALAAATANAADLNIPEQPMDSALKSLSEQARVQIIFAPEAVQGKRAPAIKGDLTPAQALQKLLHNSGLSYKSGGEGTFAVQVAPSPMTSSQPAMLDDVTVTATRTEHPVDQVPANVSVITSKDIAKRNVDKVQDLLRTVESVEAGMQFSIANSSDIDIRGVGVSSTGIPTSKVLVDGIGTDSIVSIVQGHGGLDFLSSWDVEQVEVVRGPASALYGPEVVGGVVNLIPKRWHGNAGMELHAAYGSHDTAKVGAAIGAASDSGDFRLSVYNARSGGFVAQTYPDNGMIQVDLAPRNWKDRKVAFSGGMRLSDHQELTAAYQDFATRSFTVGGHPNQYLNMDGSTWTFGYRHDIGETATLKASYRETRLKNLMGIDKEYFGMTGNLGLWRESGKFGDSSEFNIQGDWHISADNLLIAGYNRATGTGTFNKAAPTVKLYVNKSTIDGFYLQDEARLGLWNFTVGGRLDCIKLFGDTLNGISTNPESSVSVFNPRLGVQYQWTPATSFYASAGTAYVPATNAARFTDAPIPNPNLRPEKSASYEIGLRSKQVYGDFKLALFHTNYKDKITRVFPFTPQEQAQNINRLVVNGVEFGWKGRFADAWAPFMNYSYTDSRIKADAVNPQNVGTRMQWSKAHKLNLGVTYAPVETWSASLMGSYRGDQFIDSGNCATANTNTFDCHLGGYFTTDAKVTTILPLGGKDKWDAWLAVNNLTGKKYRQHYWTDVSDGRTLTLGVDGKF